MRTNISIIFTLILFTGCNRYFWWSRGDESYHLNRNRIARYDFRDFDSSIKTKDDSYNHNDAELHHVEPVQIKSSDDYLTYYGYRFKSPNDYIKITFPPYTESKAYYPAPMYSKGKAIEDNPKFTIAVWVMVEAFDNRDIQTYTIMDKSEEHWSLAYTGSSPAKGEDEPRYMKFHFKWKNCEYCDDFSITSETIIEKNKWYYVAITYDGKKMKLYVDGILEQSKRALFQPWPSGEGARNPIMIGRSQIYPGDIMPQNMYGVIDHLNMYSRDLSKKEIKSMSYNH